MNKTCQAVRSIAWVLLLSLIFTSCSSEKYNDQYLGDEIVSLTLNHQFKGEIDRENNKIEAYVPFGTDLSALRVDLYLSRNAVSTPESGEIVDFTAPVTFTVTGENGSTRNYEVEVKWIENVIEKFYVEIEGERYNGIIDNEENTILMLFPKSINDLTEVKPTVVIPEGAEVSPESGEAIDLTPDKTHEYVVTYAGSKRSYVVSSEYADVAKIESFVVDGQEAVIDHKERVVRLGVKPGTDLTSITPEVELSPIDARILKPESLTGLDFSQGAITFELESKIGGNSTYTVYVIEDVSITTFDLLKGDYIYKGRVDRAEAKIVVELPYGMDQREFSIAYKLSSDEAELTPGDTDVEIDFTTEQTFVVSQSGIENEYRVSVENGAPRVAFLSLWEGAKKINNIDEQTAYNWFKENQENGEFLSFSDIEGGLDPSFYKVIWWHNDENINLPQIAIDMLPNLKAYYEDGGALFLSTFAVQYIEGLGVPFDGKAPDVKGQNEAPVQHEHGWGISLMGYEEHKIFGGLDIWNFGDGPRLYLVADNTWRMEKANLWTIGGEYKNIDDWRTKTGGIDLGGAEWDPARTAMVSMVEFPKNNRGLNEGAVVCLGPAAYDWHVDKPEDVPNGFQKNIEQLTRNVIKYLFENQ